MDYQELVFLLRLQEINKPDLKRIGVTCCLLQKAVNRSIAIDWLNRIQDRESQAIQVLIKALDNKKDIKVKGKKNVLITIPLKEAIECIVRFQSDQSQEDNTVIVDTQEDEAKAARIAEIQDYFPHHWLTTADNLRAVLQIQATDEEIEDAKRKTVQDWFRNRNLGAPSAEQTDVICNCNNSLRVIARAGSGKTRTIAQKILFMIHYLGINTNEVLALVFNDSAMKELRERIERYQYDAGLESKGVFNILTFDALARNLLNPQSSIVVSQEQEPIIKQIIYDLLDGKEGLQREVEDLMLKCFRDDWEKTLRPNQHITSAYLDRLRGSFTKETLRGEQVKSLPEKRLADFFFEHDIPYIYEHPFPVGDGNVIRPDFLITSPYNVVIEYYGLRGDHDYERAISYKRQYWSKRRQILLIEINPGDICSKGNDFLASRESDYQYLRELLVKATSCRYTPLNPVLLSDEQVLAKMRDRLQLVFVRLLQSAISRMGQINCDDIELARRISDYQANSVYERPFLEIALRVESLYRDRLIQNNQIDFNQIKKQAILTLQSGKTRLSWDKGQNHLDLSMLKFVFVDEFQDFSELFRGLVQAILASSPGSLVNAVGDDWQMINRYAGSKPEMFDEFENDYPKPKTLYLRTNYRSAGGIVEFCNNIMSTNGVAGVPAAVHKANKNKVHAIVQLDLDSLSLIPAESNIYRGNQNLSALVRIFDRCISLFDIHQCGDDERLLFVLSRSNHPRLNVTSSEWGLRDSFNQRQMINVLMDRILPPGEKRFFEARTSHSSKGLESESVVVLHPGQFPLLHQRSMFLAFFGDTPENLIRDELNLFYVTCSRAKSRLCFLADNSWSNSPFLEGIKVTKASWAAYPPQRVDPLSVYLILVQPARPGDLALKAAGEILKAHGFTFYWQGDLPTRKLLINGSVEKALLFLKRVIRECNMHNLIYTVRDGFDRQTLRLPGPISIDEYLDGARP